VRIISGTHKGRIISPPKNLPVRPTTDFAKESLFNILNNNLDFEELSALDLFSGTGSISFELASRGCPSIIAVDNNFKCFAFIRETAEKLGLSAIKAIKHDSFGFITKSTKKFDLIFADPPYDHPLLKTLPDLIFTKPLLLPEGWFILEHSSNDSFSKHPNFIEKRTYGNVNFSIFVNKEQINF